MDGARRRNGQEGTLLIILMIGLAVASIALTAGTQAWSTTWRRDNEEELIFRGNQYVDAIIAYRKEHGGQFPLNLEDLYKPGPRRLRYIRKLYKEPIGKDGKWGLLYLMPGGQGVYDPKAAQMAQTKAATQWSAGDKPTVGGQIPGFTPFANNPGGGAPGTGGLLPGALPPGSVPIPPQPMSAAEGTSGEESVSEPPLGWPIIGVISRASGKRSEDTFKIYKGHEEVSEWQFHVFERGLDQPEAPGTAGRRGVVPAFIGPGFGGHGPATGIGGMGAGATPRERRNPPRKPPNQGGGG
jgi:type II secretory pathway pseudopilin PulG